MNKQTTAKKDYTSNIQADIPSRTVLSIISTSTVDEEGEVILPRGVQTNRFEKSPVVFWNHDYADPVGTAEYVKINDDNIMASTYFPPRPEGHEGEWRPDAVLALISAGLCKGVSIGFSYIETREPTQKDRKQFKTTGNELRRVVSKSRFICSTSDERGRFGCCCSAWICKQRRNHKRKSREKLQIRKRRTLKIRTRRRPENHSAKV